MIYTDCADPLNNLTELHCKNNAIVIHIISYQIIIIVKNLFGNQFVAKIILHDRTTLSNKFKIHKYYLECTAWRF